MRLGYHFRLGSGCFRSFHSFSRRLDRFSPMIFRSFWPFPISSNIRFASMSMPTLSCSWTRANHLSAIRIGHNGPMAHCFRFFFHMLHLSSANTDFEEFRNWNGVQFGHIWLLIGIRTDISRSECKIRIIYSWKDFCKPFRRWNGCTK